MTRERRRGNDRHPPAMVPLWVALAIGGGCLVIGGILGVLTP